MTVISRTHNVVYLKSAKTAGTAVEAHLLTRTPLGGDVWHTSPRIRAYGLRARRGHLVVGSVGGRLLVAPRLGPAARFWPASRRIQEHHPAASLARLLGSSWDRALKVTSVRNPWDIMVSAWQWRRDGKGRSPAVTASFEEWTRACLSGDDEWRARVHAYDPHRLMRRFVFVEGRPVMDVLIRQEAIDEGLRDLGERIGLELPAIEIRENQSRRRPDYRPYYTEDLAESVAIHFADIISLCGYRFDP